MADWIPYIGAVALSVISSVVTALLTKRKYTAETRSTELENVRTGSEILMDNIVRPLETQIKRLNKNVSRLEKAMDKIPACPHSAECPVAGELLANQESDDDPPAILAAERRGDRPRGRGRNRQRREGVRDGLAEFPSDDFD